MWVSEGEKTNPPAGQILADTGALSLGITAGLIITSTTPITVELVKRNALNTADVRTHPLPVSAYVLFMQSVPMPLSVGERYQLRLVGAVEGDNVVQASILW